VYERFTDRSRKVMQLANQEAQRFNHEYIGTEHILLGLIKEGAGVAAHVLKNLDVDLRKVRLEVERLVQSGPDMITMGKLPQTPRAKKVIELAMQAARDLNHNYVGTEHILIGLVKEKDGVAATVLSKLGVTEDILQDIDTLLGIQPADREHIEMNTLRQAMEEAICHQDFEKAAQFRDALERMEKSTDNRHKEALRQITSALFSLMTGNVSVKATLEYISRVLKEAGIE